MTKKVVISIEGVQRFEGEESQSVQIVTDGLMKTEGDTVYLSYEETEMTGMEGAQTTFTVEKDQVTLSRTGAVQSRMVFRRGHRDVSLYDMGFGALMIGISASRVYSNLGESGGRLEISYGIDIEEQASGTNSFLIDVRPAAQ